MNNIPSLKEQRAMKVAELRAIASKEAKGQTIDDNERKRFDELETELRALEERLRHAEVVADWERRADAQPISGTGDRSFDVERPFNRKCQACRSMLGASSRCLVSLSAAVVDAHRACLHP
jgi:hypothetical protein